MRNITYILSLLLVLFLASCGEDSKHFKIEGHLLQMNQGEFYVYGIENGTVEGIDTIKVAGGRFALEIPCEHNTILSIVFPNFSELPIFAEPGKTVKIEGDASHLKKLEVKGTKTNELMSSFRNQIANASPPETKRYATQFIEDHPESEVGIWLIRKYFIATPTPDIKEAQRLVGLMKDKQKDNDQIIILSRNISDLSKASVGSQLPSFSAQDTNGNTITSASLSTGTAIICVWASWSYNSTDMLRQLKDRLSNVNSGVKVITIAVDADKKNSIDYAKMNQMSWPIICTGELFETKVLKQLALLSAPDNMVIKNGKIVARDLPLSELLNYAN